VRLTGDVLFFCCAALFVVLGASIGLLHEAGDLAPIWLVGAWIGAGLALFVVP
jgi:hypothetical protein